LENITEEQIMQWRKHFPFKGGARENQANAIEFAIRSFVSGKRFVILEAATGVGKSAIGLTVARWLNEFLPEEDESAYKPGAYFMTTQKILQEQYMKDFGEERGGTMRQLMSSSNYTCKFHKKQTCAESLRMLKIENDKESKFYRCCSFGCVYKEEKRKFIEHRESLTNFAYFLAETYYAGKLEPRSLLVIDEAHNADLELCGFVEISFSERFAKTALKIDMPEISTQLQSINWVKNSYLPKLRDHIKHYEDTIEKFNLGEKLESNFANIAKQYEMLDKHICKINRFLEIYDDENWVFNLVEGEGSGMRKIEFKPIDVSPYSESILFNKGRRVLMMSATILNHEGFCEMLGIKDEDSAFISIPSPFPPENHPIIAAPVARMTANNIDADLPKLAEAIRSILESHSDVKGIIHTHSYKVAKYLRENIKDKRLLFHGAEDRLEKLSKHMNSKEPTVLVSPSMQEGVDLKDDLSRFQIICKVPYPYLGDKIVKKRMNRWKWWYPLQTAKTIVQSIGRSVRSSTDHATSYILDADWDRFYSKHSHLFPDTFQKSLK
jgi:ATP-dependent DNA helicase DinG